MKDALMTFRVNSQLCDDFMETVEKNHLPAAQVLWDLMRKYIGYVETRAVSDAETRCRKDAAHVARAYVWLEGLKITPQLRSNGRNALLVARSPWMSLSKETKLFLSCPKKNSSSLRPDIPIVEP